MHLASYKSLLNYKYKTKTKCNSYFNKNINKSNHKRTNYYL